MILLQVFLIIPRYCFHFLYLLASSAVCHLEKFNSLADSISCKKDIVDKKKNWKICINSFHKYDAKNFKQKQIYLGVGDL